MKKIDERGDSWEGSVLQLRRPKYNKRFYQEHKDKAEKFVYSPLPWTSMVVADIIQSRDNPGKPMARLVGADGSVVLAGERQIGSKIRNNLAGRCFDVKLVDKGDRKQAVLVRESEKTVTELFESCIGYVEYYNEDKLLAHVYDQQSNQYLVHLAPGLKAEKFIRFCPLPETGRDSHFIPHGIFISESDYETSTEAFPAHVGIVDNVNEQKQLFHCVFGTNSDSVIRFASTSIRPVVGDIVVARYVLTKGKDERLRKSVFDIKVDNSRHTPLLREAEGEMMERNGTHILSARTAKKVNRNGSYVGKVMYFSIHNNGICCPGE